MTRLARYIQGIRIFCPLCKAYVTPYTVIIGNDEGYTEAIEFVCNNGKHLQAKIAEFERKEEKGKD